MTDRDRQFAIDLQSVEATGWADLALMYARALSALRVVWASRRALQGRIAELETEQVAANKALDDIARHVRPDDDGTWTDRDGVLESIGDAIELTGRKVWEASDDV